MSIWLPNLATDWMEIRKPELKKKAFVLVRPYHGRMLILHSSPVAINKGIRKGMVLADAKAILPTLLHFDERPELISGLLKKITEWCIRFTPSASVDEPDGVILDASGCTHLWGGDEPYITEISKRFKAKGYKSRIAIAGTIGAAWANARYSGQNLITVQNDLNSILALPPESLRIEEKTTVRLHKLGLHQIQHLIQMPGSSLRRRFGDLIVQRLNQALGTEPEWVNNLTPIDPYQERLPCLEPILTRNGIEIALKRLLENLCRRLKKEGKGIRKAELKAYRIDHKISSVQISLGNASNNINHLLKLFEMKLDSMEPGPGYELFVLESSNPEEVFSIQEEFWKNSTGFQQTQLTELIDRISIKLGPESIHRYLPAEHYWPERSFKKANTLMEEASTRWFADKPRPVELLPVPERILVTAPIPDYPPMHFRYKGVLHKVVKADGPERIEQEWWINEGEHRDYYAVEVESGNRYWIFRSGHYDEEKKPGWFLHGFFA